MVRLIRVNRVVAEVDDVRRIAVWGVRDRVRVVGNGYRGAGSARARLIGGHRVVAVIGDIGTDRNGVRTAADLDRDTGSAGGEINGDD